MQIYNFTNLTAKERSRDCLVVNENIFPTVAELFFNLFDSDQHQMEV